MYGLLMVLCGFMKLSDYWLNVQHCVSILCCDMCDLQKTGINNLIQGTIIDDHLFDPCGYSVNGILPDVRGKAHSYTSGKIILASQILFTRHF